MFDTKPKKLVGMIGLHGYCCQILTENHTICEYILEKMAIFGTYVALLVAAWGMQICPRLYIPMGEYTLKLKISSISSAFIEANVYTLYTMLILMLPSRMFTNQRQWNLKWVFVMPYIMHYMTSLWSTTQNVRDLMIKPPMYMIENYGYLHLRMTLLCGLQLLAMVEIVFILFYSLKKGPQLWAN